MTRQHDIGPIVEGDTYSDSLTIEDGGNTVDITDWEVAVTVKKHVDDSPVIQEVVVNHDDPANGETSFTLSSSQTSGLNGEYAYDIEITTDTGDVATVLYGNMRFIDGVTD